MKDMTPTICSPVRYQISENNDIIKLLKYDIMMELYKKYPSSKKKTGAKLVKKVIRDLLEKRSSVTNLIKVVPLVGRLSAEVVNFTSDIKQIVDKEKQSKGGDFDKLEESIEQELFEEKLSDLLKKEISTNKDDEKKRVLIIDDLDRLDPGHVFRLLNVFSAVLDPRDGEDGENKFGFDRIIVVADHNNIKNTFHHIYGVDTSFSGYCDKFFSSKIYRFDNQKAVKAIIPQLLKKIKVHPAILKYTTITSTKELLEEMLKEILIEALLVGQIKFKKTLRTIKI